MKTISHILKIQGTIAASGRDITVDLPFNSFIDAARAQEELMHSKQERFVHVIEDLANETRSVVRIHPSEFSVLAAIVIPATVMSGGDNTGDLAKAILAASEETAPVQE